MNGEIITDSEMKECREQADILQTVINQKPSLKSHLDTAQKLLLKLGHKGMP